MEKTLKNVIRTALLVGPLNQPETRVYLAVRDYFANATQIEIGKYSDLDTNVEQILVDFFKTLFDEVGK